VTNEKHTATPWIGFYDQGKPNAILPAMRPGEICQFAEPFPSEANADFIIRAVNERDALLAALETAGETLHSIAVFVKSRQRTKAPEGEDWFDERLAMIDAAIDMAKK